MFEPGDRVKIQYGVMCNGYDLSDMLGIVKNVTGHTEVYIPDLNIVCKLFTYDIDLIDLSDPFDETTLEDIGTLFN